ncbi:NUDIX domain-containing protein [Psychrobacter alimentarius]|uniref:NUDIX domain-containing protein n=1 Tax=Psychrobacter alimentarius TaxID=261164 RepID=UPI003FD5CF78
MSSKANKNQESQKAIVNVAVAVIQHKDQYLLGFRDAAQHQGNLYEFVGGKIDNNESGEQAVIREVAEETGIAIPNSTVVKLGRLHHDYGDKQVSLQVYKVELTTAQYEQYKHCQYGLEDQALVWVNKLDLLAGLYALPAANKTILGWLSVPTTIAITYPLTHFNTYSDPKLGWLQYHQENLMPESWVYIRVKEVVSEDIVGRLMRQRPDISVILSHDFDHSFLVTEELIVENEQTSQQVVAHHLTHTTLMQWSDTIQDSAASAQLISHTHPLIVSCHDAASINVANRLASTRLEQQLPPVIGAFLSPVLMTQTHPHAEPLGWETWSSLAQLADMPIIGLGGLSPAMIDQALTYGGISVAGIRQFY